MLKSLLLIAIVLKSKYKYTMFRLNLELYIYYMDIARKVKNVIILPKIYRVFFKKKIKFKLYLQIRRKEIQYGIEFYDFNALLKINGYS